MHTIIYLVIIQAIQLPILAIIIFLCVKTHYLESDLYRSGPVEKGDPRSLSLTLIGTALFFNLIYLSVNIAINANLVEINNQDYYISMTNLLTTNCMYCAWILWFIYTHKLSLVSKAALFLFIPFATIFLQFYQTADPKDQKFIAWANYAFDCGAYLLISHYFYIQMRIPQDAEKPSKKHNILIMSFFVLWGLLQLAAPAAVSFGVSPNFVSFCGFVLSTLIKTSILYWMFSYYSAKAQSAIFVREKQNKLLENNITTLSCLQKMINQLNAAETSDEMMGLAMQHLTSKQLFQFEYVIVSRVDYIEKRIIYYNSRNNNPDNIKKLEEWKEKKGVALNDPDIVARTFREKIIIPVIGDYIDNKKIRSEQNDDILNSKIFQKYNHKTLSRYFIPITRLKEETEKEDENFPEKVAAIIEVGNQDRKLVANPKYYSATKTPDPYLNMGELKLYVESLSKCVTKKLVQENHDHITMIMNECDRIAKDNHIVYLELVLAEICKYIKAEWGILAILPYNNLSSVYEECFIHYNFEKHIPNKIKTKLKELTKGNDIQTPPPNHLLDNLGDIVNSVSNANAWIKRPIKIEDQLIGYIYAFSKTEHYFNNYIESIVDKMTAHVGKIYNEKRFHNALEKLTLPDNALTDPETNLTPIAHAIQDYFLVSKVIAVIKDNAERNSGKDKEENHKAFAKKFLIDNKPKKDEYDIIQLNAVIPGIEDNYLLEYAQKHNLSSLIQVPIRTTQQEYGIINIFFQNPITTLYTEDYQFLKIIANKGALTIQIQHLISAFLEISDSFTQNDLKQTLHTIAVNAADFLAADQNFLYAYDGDKFNIKDSIYVSNKSEENDILKATFKKQDENIPFAKQIIDDKSMYFNKEQDYLDYLAKRELDDSDKIFNKTFWEKEEIKGMAAIRLANMKRNTSNKPVGVMVICFRNSIEFTEEIKKLIQSFALFAAAAIEVGYIFKKNSQYLLDNLRMSKPIIGEMLAAGALHDSAKTFRVICLMYYQLMEKINGTAYKNPLTIADIRGDLNDFDAPLQEVDEYFKEFEKTYRPGNKLFINPTNITALINEKLSLLKTSYEWKRIKVTHPKENIEIECDDLQLSSVFHNIINNAFQALEERGTLEVIVKKLDENEVKIEVIDNGKGISEDIFDFILQPYFTDKQGGSGLGLAISDLVVARHGGTLKYHSGNKKTTFTIILPIYHKTSVQNV